MTVAGEHADDSRAPPLAMTRSPCASQPDAFPQAQTMAQFPPPQHDLLDLAALLTPRARDIRDKTRAFMVAEVAPIIADYWERAEFPHHLVPKLARLGLGGGTLSGHGCPGLTVTEFGMVRRAPPL
jgi:Acyl-CoA dehydrogenase, N-terminal domain